MKRSAFRFLKPGKLLDGDLELVLVRAVPANPVKRYGPEGRRKQRK